MSPLMGFKKTISRRTILQNGDSFIVTNSIDFDVSEDNIHDKCEQIRKQLISETRRDVLAYMEKKPKENQDGNR